MIPIPSRTGYTYILSGNLSDHPHDLAYQIGDSANLWSWISLPRSALAVSRDVWDVLCRYDIMPLSYMPTLDTTIYVARYICTYVGIDAR